MNSLVLQLQNINSQEDAFLIFDQIVNGYFFDYVNNFYVKHSSLKDSAKIALNNKILSFESKQKGLSSEEEKLQILIKNGCWSEEQEQEYKNHFKMLQDLTVSKRKLIIKSQIEQAQKLFEKEMIEFTTKYSDRYEYLGMTIESFCSDKRYEFFIKNYFFKDESLTEQIFTDDFFENCDPFILREFFNYYSDFENIFSERNMKKVACSQEASNSLYLSENPSDFYGKPITQLTNNQINLYNYHVYFKNISNHPEFKRVPQEYYNDLNKLIDYYDQQYSILCSKNNNKKK